MRLVKASDKDQAEAGLKYFSEAEESVDTNPYHAYYLIQKGLDAFCKLIKLLKFDHEIMQIILKH